MTESAHYIEWHTANTPETQVAKIMQHYQTRYELGSAVLLCDNPQQALKMAEKQWRKLTRQAQKRRETKAAANDILEITRTISRMQRVKFSVKDPAADTDAKLYILSPKDLSALPTHCFTFYSVSRLPESPLLRMLPSNALVFAFGSKRSVPGFHDKSVLEERILTEEAALSAWLHKHQIDLDLLPSDVEKANEALDTLLGSNSLQTDFLHHTKQYLQLVQLAEPLRLTTQQQTRLQAIKQLEHHVRVLSPAFLSDHIIDNQADDSFLLRDIAGKERLSLDALRAFIATQYRAGRHNLATALEQRAGFIRLDLREPASA